MPSRYSGQAFAPMRVRVKILFSISVTFFQHSGTNGHSYGALHWGPMSTSGGAGRPITRSMSSIWSSMPFAFSSAASVTSSLRKSPVGSMSPSRTYVLSMCSTTQRSMRRPAPCPQQRWKARSSQFGFLTEVPLFTSTMFQAFLPEGSRMSARAEQRSNRSAGSNRGFLNFKRARSSAAFSSGLPDCASHSTAMPSG